MKIATRASGLLALVLSVVAVVVAGCGGTTTASPTTLPATAAKAAPTAAAAAAAIAPTVAPTIAAAATKAGGATAGQMADAGAGVYASQCASCHGDKGQGVTGPALIGANAKFGRFKTGQDFLNYVSNNMPLDHPGSLSADQSLQVTAYLLVQNNVVQKDASLTSASLGSVQFK